MYQPSGHMSNHFGTSKYEEILSRSQVYRSVYVPLTPSPYMGKPSGGLAEQELDLECTSNISLFSVPIGSRHEPQHHANQSKSPENGVHGGPSPQVNNRTSSRQHVWEDEPRVISPGRKCGSPRGTRYGRHHRKASGPLDDNGPYDRDARSRHSNHIPLSESIHAHMHFTRPDSHGNIVALANGTRYTIPQDGSPVVIPLHRTSTRPPIEHISRKVYEKVRTQEFADHFGKENCRPRRRDPPRHREPNSGFTRHDSATADSVRHGISTDRGLGPEHSMPDRSWQTCQSADTRSKVFELEASTPALYSSPVLQPSPDTIYHLPLPRAINNIPSSTTLTKSRPLDEREIKNFHDWRAERDECGRRGSQGQYSHRHTRSMSHGGHVEWCRPSQSRTRSYDVPPPGSSPLPPLPVRPTGLSTSRPSSVDTANAFGPVRDCYNRVSQYCPWGHLEDRRRGCCASAAATSNMAHRAAKVDRRGSDQGQREMYIRKMEVSPGRRTRPKVRFVLP